MDMDQVNVFYSKSNLVSEPVKGHNIQKEWTDIFNSVGFNLGTVNDEHCRQNVANKLNMNINSPEYLVLERVCSISKLQCETIENIEILSNMGSIRRTVFNYENKGPKSKEDLSTLNFQIKDVKKRQENQQYRINLRSHFRYLYFPEQSTLLPKTAKGSDIYRQLPNNELLFIVHVFRPVHSNDYLSGVNRPSFPKLIDQVLVVLGSQKLIALKDAITCCSDHVVLGEFSDNPSAVPTIKAKEEYRSGFFYIGGTFYNDLRTSAHKDYSGPLIKYAQDSGRIMGPFSSCKMEATFFQDLEIQLGYPYLYMHQGKCEHVFVFTDIRILNPEESHQYDAYPVLYRVAVRHKLKCMICSTHTSKWVTYGNKRVSNDPYFFCDVCFRSFNYTRDGKKIGNFRAYVYVDRTLC